MPTIGHKKLRLPQLRVLAILADGSPLLTRSKIAEKAGFSAVSGTVTRVLNGVKQGSSSGAARPGLMELGMLVKVELDIDGVTEVGYQITEAGREALRKYQRIHNQLPPLRRSDISTNKRYKREKRHVSSGEAVSF